MRSERKKPAEFGGTFGAIVLVCGLPVAVFCLNLTCNKEKCSIFELPNIPTLSSLIDIDAFKLVFSWFLLHMIISILPIGPIHKGLPIKQLNNKQLEYRCNSLYALIISLTIFFLYWINGGSFRWLHEHFIQMAFAALVLSVLLSIFLFVKSFQVDEKYLAHNGNTNSEIFNFWMGRELNPRVFGIDLKFVCELRPGLIGWLVLDLSFLFLSFEKGTFTWSLAFVVFGHCVYVIDALINEPAILSTMDITDEGFGYMLSFGDLCWVPFLYTLQARYLFEHPQHWNAISLGFFILAFIIGYAVFRLSNNEKNKFRTNPKDPSIAHLKTLSTKSGRKLLISGFWGISRHPNYMGDLIMSLSWSLPSGSCLISYFYPIYFLGLLITRFERDEVNCRKKYGEDWNKYCEKVPYKIFPYIY